MVRCRSCGRDEDDYVIQKEVEKGTLIIPIQCAVQGCKRRIGVAEGTKTDGGFLCFFLLELEGTVNQ